MNRLTAVELIDIIENRHSGEIKYLFIMDQKLYELNLEDVIKTDNGAYLYFLNGDFKLVLDQNMMVVSNYENQYELMKDGKYMGSITIYSDVIKN